MINAIPKSWKEELRRSNRISDALSVYDHHLIKKNQIYSLDKCNSKELYCLQISLNNSKTRSQLYFEDLFHGCIETNLLWYKFKKFLKTKIDLPLNTPQSAIFGFLNYENNSDTINHLLLIFKYYLFNSRGHKKLSFEVLKKEIVKIYNIEKQIRLNDFKKMRKFRKKWEIIGHLLQ